MLYSCIAYTILCYRVWVLYSALYSYSCMLPTILLLLYTLLWSVVRCRSHM